MTALTHQPRFVDQLRQNEQTIMELQQRIKELEDGLRPFARMSEAYRDLADSTDIDGEWLGVGISREYRRIMVSNFRRAASLLPETKTND